MLYLGAMFLMTLSVIVLTCFANANDLDPGQKRGNIDTKYDLSDAYWQERQRSLADKKKNKTVDEALQKLRQPVSSSTIAGVRASSSTIVHKH